MAVQSCIENEKQGNSPTFGWVQFYEDVAEFPSHLLEVNGHYWLTEIFNKRVVSTDNLHKKAEPLGVKLAPKIASPHFIDKFDNRVFISEGWGSRILEYDIYNETMRFLDVPKLNAPHGVCNDGNWLYIADSLNSRIVRTKLDDKRQIEVFADYEKKISYGRQIVCHKHGVYIANTYEAREGLNSGEGSNVLLIEDFQSGLVKEIARFHNTNTTGLEVIGDKILLVSLWQQHRIAVVDLQSGRFSDTLISMPEQKFGPPYGIYYSKEQKKLFVTFIGDIYGKGYKGGVAEYDVRF